MRLFRLGATVMLLGLLSACAPSAPAQPTQAGPVANTTVPTDLSRLRVGVALDSPPFTDQDSSGEPVGFEIDLIRTLAQCAQVEIDFVERPFGQLVLELRDGMPGDTFDLAISSLSQTPDRPVLWSEAYLDAGLVLVVPQGSPVRSAADLPGRRVGVQVGSTAEEYARDPATGAEPQVFNTINEAIAALDRGELEALIHDRPLIAGQLAQYPDLNLQILEPQLSNELYRIALRPGLESLKQQIDGCLDEANDNGSFAELYQRWLQAEPPRPSAAEQLVEVLLVYGSEKRSWLQPLVEQFNAQGRTTESGLPIKISALPLGSLEAGTRIVNGSLQATVWVPASSLAIGPVAERWRNANASELIAGDAQPLLRSPLVIAMWEPMVEVLRQNGIEPGWRAMHDLVGREWAEFGHPEWGRFSLGHTHPEYSNSGLSTLLALAYAGAQKTSGLSSADLERPEVQQFIARVEDSIINYGESTGFFADAMLDCSTGGPAYLSAAVVYENTVVDQGAPCPGQPRLVAIYPPEGSFVSDHPYVLLNAAWVSAEQRNAAIAFQQFLLEPAQQQQAVERGFRPADPTSTLGLPQGVDASQPAQLLAAPEVALIEQSLQTWVALKRNADIVAVLDTSGSMAADGKMETARRGLEEFVLTLGETDRLQFISFSRAITEELTQLDRLSSVRNLALERLRAVQPDGPTCLYDATLRAYQAMQQQGDPANMRAIVLLTDGRDEVLLENGTTAPCSRSSKAELLDTISAGAGASEGIRIFTIAYGADADQEVLEQIARASGGEAFVAGPADIWRVYQEIVRFFS